MKKMINIMFSRIFLTGILIIIQIAYIILSVMKLSEYSTWINAALSVLSLLMSLYIIKRDDNSSYKVIWILVMGLLPIFGGLMYLFVGNKRPARNLRKKMEAASYKGAVFEDCGKRVMQQINGRTASTCEYLTQYGGFPAYENSSVKYYRCGEDMFSDMIEELKKAKHFIFIEYFIIATGEMWGAILEILEQKAAEGVDVRIIYDDVGCVTLLPVSYPAMLEKKGIKCIAFNKFIPVVSVVMNHRDHRKIMDIDGHTAFTGGVNLSDEYINRKPLYGYWKDTAVMVKGEAVLNFTVMFAEMWNSFSKDKIDCNSCRPEKYAEEPFFGTGFVQPFADSPLDNEQVGENVYLEILSQAERYVYIYTPYLIIDDQMRTALCMAAKRGVDVRIVTPGIPDKKSVFRVTRSYYSTLISAGVRIYEYTPGFIHAKSFICDDRIAVVGSINMDFRSLYLHFECGVFMCSNEGEDTIPAIMDLKQDCIDTFAQSREILADESSRFGRSMIDSLLRAVSPLI